MGTIARNANALSKRVGRFLDRERSQDKGLDDLLGVLSEGMQAYLFGGVLRDIALFGIEHLPSDLDLVYEGSGACLRTAAVRAAERNRFGGLRIETERWVVDIWPACDTWAFREGVREYQGIESLLDTTITNWESVLYRLDQGTLIYRDRYFEDLCDRYLDIVCEQNPNALGMYVRLLKAYVCKEAALLSRKAADVIASGLRIYSLTDVNAYEREHYGRVFIDDSAYGYLMEYAEFGEAGLLGVMLEGIQRPLPLDVKGDRREA